MELREYLYNNRIRQIQCAKETGVSTAIISSICCGHKKYSLEVCRKISKWTKGEVKVEELRPPKPVYRLCPTCGKRGKVK